MTGLEVRRSRQPWRRILRITGFLSAIAVVVSVVVSNFFMETFSAGLNLPGLIISIVMPITLGTPMILMFQLKHEQLRRANEMLAEIARTDSLTGCLNRGAFAARVTEYLARTQPTAGALLMIDADKFKMINDLFGHDRGDEALTLISGAIQQVLGATDFCGRMGGEEFAVFMPNASETTAEHMAERICRSVAQVDFLPAGKRHPLSVSIGGAVFAGPSAFADLFRIADQRLYGAKNSGRNRSAIVHAEDHPNIGLMQTA